MFAAANIEYYQRLVDGLAPAHQRVPQAEGFLTAQRPGFSELEHEIFVTELPPSVLDLVDLSEHL